MSLAVIWGGLTVLLWAVLAVLAVWYRPPRPVSPLAFWLAIAGVCWSVGEVLTGVLAFSAPAAASPSAALSVETGYWLSLVVEYTGIVFIGPLWWAVIAALAIRLGTAPRFLSPLTHYGPLFLSLSAWLMLVTNPWHAQFIEPVIGGRNAYGPFWYYQAGYGYLAMIAGQVLIVRSWTKLPKGSRFRSQLAVLFCAGLLPHLANLLYISRTVELETDPTVSAFGIAIAFSLAGLPRRGLFGMSGLTLEHWLDHETDGVAIIDADGRLVRANRAAATLLDVPELSLELDLVDFLGARLRAPEDEGAMGRERLEARLRDADSVSGTVFRLVSDPNRWIRLRTTRIPARWPSRGGLALSLRDESRLLTTSDRASRQAVSIEAILGSIQDGLFVADERGRIVYANERFWELWDLPGVLSPSATESQLLDVIRGRIARASDADEPLTSRAWTDETDVRLHSGRILSYGVMPLVRGESAVGRVWTFRDRTEHHRAQEQRRTADERIRTSHKLESLGILASSVAHDFNNLLVGIMGNVDLALAELPGKAGSEPSGTVRLDADVTAAVREYLGRAGRSADRAAELVQQLLAYAGRGRLETEVLDFSSLVEDTLDIMRTLISKRATLRVHLEPEANVLGDAVQLRQIVMNLLTNASEALEEQDGTISIRTATKELSADKLAEALPQRSEIHEGRYVELAVTDTGCGISASKLNRIFEPFYSTKVNGRGFGLSSVLGTVRRHGGFVKVRSDPDKGSTFVLWFPLVASMEAEVEGVLAKTSGAIGATSVAPAPVPVPAPVLVPVPVQDRTVGEGSSTVLVVDDEPAVREVAERALVLAGYDVIVARDGKEAVRLYREHEEDIDAVLLDLTMPRMDGAETLFSIRQISRSVPIVLTSGYSEAQSMERTAGLAFVSFIRKPYTASAIVQKIHESVREAAAEDERGREAGRTV